VLSSRPLRGKGGIDDAEDAEVILHDYGHAIHFSQNLSFASEQAGAISEGFADYWAYGLGRGRQVARRAGARAAGVRRRLGLDVVHERRAALPLARRRELHYPTDLDGEVHDDGRIWSRALWDIRQKLGHVEADTIILQGSFDFPGTTMPDLANRTVAAAQQLYGNAAAKVVRQAFVDRGILT
jgi:Zn-dependent metalloprotease